MNDGPLNSVKQAEEITKKNPLFVAILLSMLVAYIAYSEYTKIQERNYQREEEAQKRVDSYMAFMQTAITKIEENQRTDSKERRKEMQYVYNKLLQHTQQIEEISNLLIDYALLPLRKDDKGRSYIQTPRDRAEMDMVDPNLDKHRYWLGIGPGNGEIKE